VLGFKSLFIDQRNQVTNTEWKNCLTQVSLGLISAFWVCVAMMFASSPKARRTRTWEKCECSANYMDWTAGQVLTE